MKKWLAVREVGTLVLLILVMGAAGIKEPRYLQATNLQSIFLWIPLLAVVGLGQMMVIVTRGIDVSVGSIVGMSAIVTGMVFRANPNMNLAFAALVGLVVGLVLGCINGALIAFSRIPPIITTLGALSAYRGLVFIISHGTQIDSNNVPDALVDASSKGPLTIGGLVIPWVLILSLLVAGIAAYFLRMTRTGRDIYAYGSHPEAARLRGIPVQRIQFLVYAITGALSGLAGLIYLSRFGFANPSSAGSGLELMVIAAVVIGGTNIAGGSGSVLGVLLGSCLLGAINVALAVLSIDEKWQQLLYGGVILTAVLADALVNRIGRSKQVAA